MMAAGALTLALAAGSAAQETAKVTLDVSETVFGVTAALNACGYDAGLRESDPVRQQVRAEFAQAAARSPEARATLDEVCRFYRDHQQPDPALNLAQYVSLALNLGHPPDFALLRKESDLPPDTEYIQGFSSLLRRFYSDLHGTRIWEKHRAQYESLIQRYHEPVTRTILATDIYLKMPISGYVGREFTVYLEPLAAPGQVNSRNFGLDYSMVIGPEDDSLHLDEVRHAYLHYLLDPMTLKRANALKRLDPLLASLKNAPLAEQYKYDTSLLVTECLIRAIEARTLDGGKATEPAKRKLVDESTRQGFVLTGYFYNALVGFEKGPTGLSDAFSDLLYEIDVVKEKKLASEIVFSSEATPEVVRASRKRQASLLDLAEDRMATGDLHAAERLARQALDDPGEDPARALFILARTASLNADVNSARTYFERTLSIAREPRLVAWSHIYLGRIFDLQDNRESAVQHYRAALAAGDTTPDTRTAAERGLKEPYQAPHRDPKANEGQH
jgi:tetratricopeptide (TPR) repeat protein